MPKSAQINFTPNDFTIDDLENAAWETALPVKIKSSWNGQRAPVKRRFETRMLWSDSALYVKFDATQGEPLVINKFPKLNVKTPGLWARDVCELFMAPDTSEPWKYFEFEVAPTGEWLDLQIHLIDGERRTNADWISGMRTATRISHDLIVMAFRVEWSAFGISPKAGDLWLGNLFRCVGRGKTRGYLAWSATRTEEPDFHVPDRFGEFVFRVD